MAMGDGDYAIEGIIFGDRGIAITFLNEDEMIEADDHGILFTHQVQIPDDANSEVKEMILQIVALSQALVQLAHEETSSRADIISPS